jgi:glycosyltransferase involved in cell wall biosynthesis
MISVVIPAYNEENAIEKTIKEIEKVMKKNKIDKNSEIIVVNDGSTDNTGKVAKKSGAVVINNPSNMGYGFSLKRGIKQAKNETIVITDADLTYPFDQVPKMLKKKEEGFDLVVGARTGKYYRQSIFKSILRKMMKLLVEFVSGKKIKDINSGLRIFDKSLVIHYFPRLCDTFSFTTSQTLAYLMNNHFVCYVDIPYNKRMGKSKIRLFRDTLKSLRYITESCIYYNPLKIFTLLSIICIVLSIIGFLFSHFMDIHAGYILGIGGLLVSIVVFSIGLLAVILKQIMDKSYDKKDI